MKQRRLLQFLLIVAVTGGGWWIWNQRGRNRKVDESSRSDLQPSPFHARELEGHESPGETVVRVDERRVLIHSLMDRTLKLWDVEKAEEVRALPFGGRVLKVAVWPDQKLLAVQVEEDAGEYRTGEKLRLAIFDLATGSRLRTLTRDLRKVNGIAFRTGSHSRRLLLTSSTLSRRFSEIRAWDIETGEVVRRLRVRGQGTIAVRPDGKLLAVYSGEREPRQPTREEPYPFNAQILIYDYDAAEALREIDANPERREMSGVHAEQLSFSPDGKRIALGDRSGRVSIWSVVSGFRVAKLDGNGASVVSMSFNESGNLMAVADGARLRIWNLSNKEIWETLHGHLVFSRAAVFAASDSRLVSIGEKPTALLWSLPPP